MLCGGAKQQGRVSVAAGCGWLMLRGHYYNYRLRQEGERQRSRAHRGDRSNQINTNQREPFLSASTRIPPDCMPFMRIYVHKTIHVNRRC